MRNRTRNIKTNNNIQGKRYYQPIKYPNIPLSSSDIYVLTTVGDRLDSLANQFYNDIRLWWIITNANPQIIRRDSYSLKPNLEIRIPVNITQILKEFEQINQ
tara:strand:- start:4888 stop:5193 length:306 start_codon:yes stop_codon:yes gene_type:complete